MKYLLFISILSFAAYKASTSTVVPWNPSGVPAASEFSYPTSVTLGSEDQFDGINVGGAFSHPSIKWRYLEVDGEYSVQMRVDITGAEVDYLYRFYLRFRDVDNTLIDEIYFSCNVTSSGCFFYALLDKNGESDGSDYLFAKTMNDDAVQSVQLDGMDFDSVDEILTVVFTRPMAAEEEMFDVDLNTDTHQFLIFYKDEGVTKSFIYSGIDYDFQPESSGQSGSSQLGMGMAVCVSNLLLVNFL